MQHSIAPRVAAAIASIVPVLATAATLPAYRDFGDWTVVCDNVGDCEARGFDENGDDRVALRFTRAAGASGAPSLTLHGLPARSGATLRFDDTSWRPPTGTASVNPDDATGAGDTALTLTGLAAVRGFARMAHRASRVSSGDRDGSLAGFDAAMLFIDDVQGRVDTPTAIARPGGSAGRIPGPHALPVVHARPLQAALDDASARRYIAALPADALDCEDPRDDDTNTVVPLGTDDVIALQPCYRGAYQTGYAVFRGPRSDPKRARLLELPYPPGASGDAGLLVEAAIDSATGRLSMFAKGRGLADCGESGEWAFDGYAFVPVAYAMLGRCGWFAPGDYPELWRANVVLENAR